MARAFVDLWGTGRTPGLHLHGGCGAVPSTPYDGVVPRGIGSHVLLCGVLLCAVRCCLCRSVCVRAVDAPWAYGMCGRPTPLERWWVGARPACARGQATPAQSSSSRVITGTVRYKPWSMPRPRLALSRLAESESRSRARRMGMAGLSRLRVRVLVALMAVVGCALWPVRGQGRGGVL